MGEERHGILVGKSLGTLRQDVRKILKQI